MYYKTFYLVVLVKKEPVDFTVFQGLVHNDQRTAFLFLTLSHSVYNDTQLADTL